MGGVGETLDVGDAEGVDEVLPEQAASKRRYAIRNTRNALLAMICPGTFAILFLYP